MILCIPGFLGLASDFDWLAAPHTTIDLFSDPSIPDSLEDVANTVFQRCNAAGICTLLGYSLGGRIALQTLCQYPDYFTDACIISAHTGLTNPEEQNVRIAQDATWAEKFLSLPWEDVLYEWNNQEVLAGYAPVREESSFLRTLLARALSNWSLGKQKNLLPLFPIVSTRITWFTGARDSKFTAIAIKACQTLAHANHITVDNAGHRVHLESSFQEIFERFFPLIAHR